MKVHPFGTNIISNLVKWNNNFKLDSLDLNEESDTVIVLGDGTPDDISIFLIASKLNGKKAVYMLKPDDTRYSAANEIRTVLKSFNEKIVRFIFVVDQEKEELSKIAKSFTGKLKELGIEILREEKLQDRVDFFDSKLGSLEFKVYLVVNGLDEINTEAHAIEDHLLKCTQKAGLPGPNLKGKTSKEVWKELFKNKQSKEKEKILSKIYQEALKAPKECFPQQYKALSLIEV